MSRPNPKWNETSRTYRTGVCLHELFVEQALRTPDQTALVFESETLSYEELLFRSTAMADILRSNGIGDNRLVGVCLDRSPNLMIALLGTLQAGAAYVPLDPSYPRHRWEQIVEDAQPSIVLTDRQSGFNVGLNDRPTIIQLDSDVVSDRAAVPATSPVDVVEQDLAYVIYTSGTTGKPKGVMNAHRGICNRLFWMQEEYQLDASDTVLQKTPITFDVSVWELFWPLITGARLVLARPDGHKDGHYLCELIQEHQVTVMHFVPSMLRMFLEQRDLGRCRSLRDVICSGEALTADLQSDFFKKLDANLHNLYGPTEAAIDVTSWQCQRDSDDTVVPIGQPIANTQIHILDEQLQPADVGNAGELHIGGAQVARGYLNRPELTAERFVDDPFSEQPNARLYKTGDLARYRPDGVIEFLGRMDDQVKIHGFRIELGEIENALADHDAVRQAVVTVTEHDDLDRRLVAHVLPNEMPADQLKTQLQAHLAQHLPDYMVPSAIHFVDEIPLSSSGKADRRALAASIQRPARKSTPASLPRTALQHELAAMWCEVLKLDEVGIHERFFELGGNSLLAARFVNRLQKTLDEFIYIVTIFDAPTIAAYASLLERDYAVAVERWLGSEAVDKDKKAAVGAAPSIARIDSNSLDRFQECVPIFVDSSVDGAHVASAEAKNRRMIFVLAPPRSGTTLFRVMLAGHSQLFAAAELQLLNFNTLAERDATLIGKFAAWKEGTVRALMELHGCSAESAGEMIADRVLQGQTTKQFYCELQEWISTDDARTLVDKSPHYALDPLALRKALEDFDRPFFIHLTREPTACVRSFQRQHMEQVLFLNEHNFRARQLAELTWTQSHRNILEFLELVPDEQQCRVSFEELVAEPKSTMRTLCSRLAMPYEPAMAEPYDNLQAKMVDGIHAESQPMGDQRFLQHGKIDATIALPSRETPLATPLSEITVATAQYLGYGANGALVSGPVKTGRRTAHARRQRRMAARKQ